MQIPQPNQPAPPTPSSQFSSKSSDYGETLIYFLNSGQDESNAFEEEFNFQFQLTDEENKNKQEWAYDHPLSEISQGDCL